MRFGIVLPQVQAGQGVSISTVVEVAKRAESAGGVHSVWVTDRLLWPLEPRTAYPASPDGQLPSYFQNVFGPLAILAYLAGCTQRVKLGTAVLNAPWYNPVLIARDLTTIDHLSTGRLRVGLGQGWSEDEAEAARASMQQRGAYLEEFVQVLNRIWRHDVVEFKGKFFSIPRSHIRPKPIQSPAPPIYLAGFTQPGIRRAATISHGWMPTGFPLDVLKSLIPEFKRQALEAGQPGEVILRQQLALTDQLPEHGRYPLIGSKSQVCSDLSTLAQIGVDEVVIDALGLLPEIREYSREPDEQMLTMFDQVFDLVLNSD